ncbi:MAG: hypothetical protein HN353_10575 [Bdellovibrionales bacterium]|jgi:5-(carboxyamino)imidazole ribonucleotide mutase|nr:hypothetical protein [Bdellovibrionales bacterium]MBT3524738.1 hypothetical protein [Bdellovibrionales bacterium]MBT7668644.1 hypothetical protein [Bdellovibrionales bacterium]
MRILAVFGSKSDQPVYQQLTEQLGKLPQVSLQIEILSAHRNPVELDQRLQQADYDLIIAGAGLAAHLPGVIASKVKTPVFGIPVNSYFGGLDAFASTIQMPFPIPVLAAGPNHVTAIYDFLAAYFAISTENNLDWQQITVVIPPQWQQRDAVIREQARMQQYADQHQLTLQVKERAEHSTPSISLVCAACDKYDPLAIHTPIIEQEERIQPQTLLQIMEWSKSGGLWVGANNGRNAIVAYQQLFLSNL